MRHNRANRKLGRIYNERKQLLENLVTSLLKYQQIKTTVAKAKEARRLADHVITLGKQNTLHAKRQVFSILQDHTLTSKVFTDIAPRFKSRAGGYTRVLHLDRRKGDGAEMALLELTEKEIIVKQAPKEKTKKKSKETAGEGAAKPSAETKAHDKDHPKHDDHKDKSSGKANPGFFKNIGKFFKNKGGGN
ncbi:MAG: 50S ribosomal protein L17 [Candidatus Omnitrophica bacterium]|nr:50S ribosomal protein L17 [Candidatus Omnitrophota bacterium]